MFSKCKKGAIVIAAIVAVVLGSASSTAAAAEPTTPSYLAVIDAGSSGTRLTLFADDPGSLVPVELTQAAKRTAGISSYASSPDRAGPEAITPLLDQLRTYLNQANISPADVPVALLATAGMRNVQRDNPGAAQAIFVSTAAAIAESGHPTAANRILPGLQEATLAWLDTNALAGTLQQKRNTIGIVEIGGASAQVAFQAPKAKGRGISLVQVEGAQIPVFAASYLGLGGNDARTLMQGQNDAGSFCFPNNVVGAEPVRYVANSARPVAADTARFSWDRCSNAYRGVITEVGGQRTSAAPIAPWRFRNQSTFSRMSFVGLGSIPFTYSDLAIASTTRPEARLKSASIQTCAGQDAWAKVQAKFIGRSSAFADTLCSTSAYQHEFLFGSRGVGIDPKRFTFGDQRFPRSPAWTSGYAITVLDP